MDSFEQAIFQAKKPAQKFPPRKHRAMPGARGAQDLLAWYLLITFGSVSVLLLFLGV
ncbi:MAG TPA: hypothetical protein VL588_05270 [Bdellovibrionota bacterium]|jgi:hypothetical protein|nr:hypothetical protein [Bdellovibrionota bacterium]